MSERAGPRRRPRTADGRRRVEVHLSEAELSAIRAAADGPGRGLSLSRFIAEAALQAAAVVAAEGSGAPIAPSRQSEAVTRAGWRQSSTLLGEIADAVAAVNRVGNNLNQLARERNATGLRPVGSLATELHALSALQHLAKVAEAAAPAQPRRVLSPTTPR